jgi:hypothetical protein
MGARGKDKGVETGGWWRQCKLQKSGAHQECIGNCTEQWGDDGGDDRIQHDLYSSTRMSNLAHRLHLAWLRIGDGWGRCRQARALRRARQGARGKK